MPANRARFIACTAAFFLALAQFSAADESVTRAEALNAFTGKMSWLLWTYRQEHFEGLGLPIGDLERLVEELASEMALCVLDSFLTQAKLQQIDEQGVLELLIGQKSESKTIVESSLNINAVRKRIRGCNKSIEWKYGVALG